MVKFNKKDDFDENNLKEEKPLKEQRKKTSEEASDILSGGSGDGEKLDSLSNEKIIKIIESNLKTFFWDFNGELLEELFSKKETRSIGLPKEIFSEDKSTFYTGDLVININDASSHLKLILKRYFDLYKNIENNIPDYFFTKFEQLVDSYLAKKPEHGDETKYISYALIYVKILAIVSSSIFIEDNRCDHIFEKLVKLEKSQSSLSKLLKSIKRKDT